MATYKGRPAIARGNPFLASVAVTDSGTGLAKTGLALTGFIALTPDATEALDDTLSVACVERSDDTSTTARPYDVTFPGDAITDQLASFDYVQKVWLIFTAPGDAFRIARDYYVIPGEDG